MSARHRHQKDLIRDLSEAVGDIETRIAAYAIVASDMDESEVVAHVMISTRGAELEILLGRAHTELSRAKQALALMPKRKETARV